MLTSTVIMIGFLICLMLGFILGYRAGKDMGRYEKQVHGRNEMKGKHD